MANKRYVDHRLLAQILAGPPPYDFHESVLIGLDLSAADLTRANFRGAVLIGVLLPSDDHCGGADFNHCIAIGSPLPPSAHPTLGYVTILGYEEDVPFSGWSPEALPDSHVRSKKD